MTSGKHELPPVLVRRHEEIDVKRAMVLTGFSDRTIRRLFDKFKLGAKMDKNSPLRISEPALIMVMHGDYAALERLRAGDRAHATVARYFEQLGYVLIPGKRTKVDEPLPAAEWRRRRELSRAEIRELELQ